MIDIPDVMMALAKFRKAYHSEADFQHAFAWEIHRRFPESIVRLEIPLSANGKILHLDFLIQLPGKRIAVELKYKTGKLMVDLEGEAFQLASHRAHDIGRYDFIKDICRLEDIASNVENCGGWAILLTNDSAYWRASSKETVDAAFRLTEGRILHGPLGWTENASDGTKKNRESELQVKGEYSLTWREYADPSSGSYGRLRYLAVHVPALLT